MPSYEVTTPNGTFQIDSPNELSDDEIKAQLGSYQEPQATAPQPSGGYLESVGRRVGEAGEAALAIPSSLANVVTGGGKPAGLFTQYPRIAAALKLAQGMASPLTILGAPVEAAGETLARGVGANEPWSRLAGDITGAVGTLGLGLLAKAGKLGAYGSQLAKVMGVGRAEGTLAEQLAHDPQLRYVLGRDAIEPLPLPKGMQVYTEANLPINKSGLIGFQLPDGRYVLGPRGSTHAGILEKLVKSGVVDATEEVRPGAYYKYNPESDLPPAWEPQRASVRASDVFPDIKGPDRPDVTNALEQLVRSSTSMEDIALSLKSPDLARNFLEQKQIKADVWGDWAKRGAIIDDLPEPASFSPKEMVTFQPTTSKDRTLFGALGTPTNVAARLNPQAAGAAYDMALSEMAVKQAVEVRGQRVTKALEGVGDEDLRRAIWARETLTPEQIATHRGLNDSTKRVIEFIDKKYAADREIIVPRLRESLKSKLLSQYERKAIKAGEELTDGTLEFRANEKAMASIPDNWGLDQYFTHIFPGQYKIVGEGGKVLGNATTKLDAKILINDLVEAGEDASKLSVKSTSYFDSDLLSYYKGRVGRTIDSISEGAGLSAEEVKAAANGDFSVGGKTKFWGSLISRQGNAKGYTKDLEQVLAIYDRGLERWMQLTDLSNRVAPTIKELGTRGYTGLASMLETSLQRLWGYRTPFSQELDNTLQAIPWINQVVAPQAFERWTAGLKNGIVNVFLKYNPRFHGVNATQTLSTLWPIADAKTMLEGAKLMTSNEGKTILANHGISTVGGKVEGFSKSLGMSERVNQELAFLSMYNKARKLGLGDQQAGDYAKLRGNLYTQFTGLTTDVPLAFTKLGPLEISTLFLRFPFKQYELLLDIMKDRNFPAAAKWLGVNLALGGFKAASLGQAGWLTQKLYQEIEKEYGKATADMFHVGLPSLIGVDLSNSVMLYNPPFGDGWAEKVGNTLGGVVGSLASSAIGAAAQTAAPEPEATKRVFNALVSRIPLARQLDGLRRMYEQDYDFKDPIGRLRYKGDFKDAVKQLMGARSTDDAQLDTFAGALMDVESQRRQVLDYVASRWGQAQLVGIGMGQEMDKAIKQQVDNWNSQWPEFPITGSEIQSRAQRRMHTATQSLRERLLMGAPRAIRQSAAFGLEAASQPATLPLVPGGN